MLTHAINTDMTCPVIEGTFLEKEIHGEPGRGTVETRVLQHLLSSSGVVPTMRIALTGTPGAGKSSVGAILRAHGLTVIEVSDIASEAGLLHERDESRGSFEVDLDELEYATDRRLADVDAILVGHLSHLVRHDLCIVLRCSPSVLRSRLEGRGWSASKVNENVEAEALDSILVEALEEEGPVLEVDTSKKGPAEVADAVMEILAGKTEKYQPGHIDWSGEVLQWY
jgi:adenylate kinase